MAEDPITISDILSYINSYKIVLSFGRHFLAISRKYLTLRDVVFTLSLQLRQFLFQWLLLSYKRKDDDEGASLSLTICGMRNLTGHSCKWIFPSGTNLK